MGILSEEEKQELKSLARSTAIREEFRQLRTVIGSATEGPVDIDQLLSFLTTWGRLCTVPAVPRTFVPYTVVRI